MFAARHAILPACPREKPRDMSLINEALKKAEQARAGGLPEAPAAPATPVIAKRGRAIGTRTLVLLGALLVLLVMGGVTLLVLPSGSDPAPAPRGENVAKSKPPAETKSAAAEPSARTEGPSTVPTPKPAATANAAPPLPAPTAVTAKKAPSANTPPADPPATPPPAAGHVAPGNPPVSTGPAAAPAASPPTPAAPLAPASSPPAPAATTAPRADDRVAEHLDRLRILGVRSPGPEARVLIGERVYRINDLVDRALGLRLQKVEPGRITFVDAAGATYTKNY